MGYQVMVLAAWFPSGTALISCHERTLSQVGTHPDMTLDVIKTLRKNPQETSKCLPIDTIEAFTP